MHGNETTTTKALFDLIPWLVQHNQKALLEHFTFYIIPQLNPDGAKAYTRLNANQVDLNRDAIDLSQPESKVLRTVFERVNPDYALNLHGQRTIYGAGSMGEAATLSFLAPSADLERSVNPSSGKSDDCYCSHSSRFKRRIAQRNWTLR
jgi:predicted deacylase